MNKEQYLLGKVVGIFLYNGFLVRDGIGIHIKGYGQDFTREVYKTLDEFVELHGYNNELIAAADSTRTYYIKDINFRGSMSTLLGIENKYVDSYKADKIVEYAMRYGGFKRGLLEMFEKDEEYEFRDGTIFSYEEEWKIWQLV